MSERYIVAIEIGSSKVRGAVGIADEAGMVDVIAAEEEKSIDSVRYGCIQNVDVSNAVSRICERLEGYPRLKDATIVGAYVGIGGKSLSSKIVEVSTILPAEMEITPSLIAELKSKAEAMAPEGRDVVDVVPVRFTVDNKAQVNPVGVYGTQLGARMAVVSCIPQIKRMLRRVLNERMGLNINGYIPRPLAEASLVLTDDERRLGCMFVDFGAETTTVMIYKNGAPLYLATLPMGSRNITLDLTSLNYIEEKAEEIKRHNATALPQEGVRRPGADGIDYTAVNNYVHARAAEIVQNIIAQIGYAELKSSDLPGGIVIVGGGARLRGFNELLSKQSEMRVRQGAVQSHVRISDSQVEPSESIDVISVLLAASKLPEAECLEFPEEELEETPQTTSGSYDDLYREGDEDDGESRIGRDEDDDDEPRKPSKKKEKVEKRRRHDDDFGGDEDEDSGSSMLGRIKGKLAGLFGGDDSFQD